MRLLSVFVLASAAFAQTGGWTDLFPDERFTGWTRVAIPSTKPPGDIPQWKVDSARRVIVCEGNGGHDMMLYDRELKNFILHVEWRFTPVANETRYNSGIFVRTSSDGVVWHQAQAGLTGGFLFGDTPVKGARHRINLRQQMTENRVKPAGEWNTYEITCDGKRIALAVNGAVTSEFNECETPKGHIGLEAEGYRIEFRNLRLKELP